MEGFVDAHLHECACMILPKIEYANLSVQMNFA